MAQTESTFTQGAPGASPAEQAQEKVQAAADQARQKASQVTGQARSQVKNQVDQRTTEAGEVVRSTADDLRTVGKELRNQGKGGPANLADQVADRAERFADYLKDSDGAKILTDVERFARRQPWVVVAGGVATGFVASRILKASSNRRYSSLGSTGDAPVDTTTRSSPATQSRPPSGPTGYGTPGSGDLEETGPNRPESGSAVTGGA